MSPEERAELRRQQDRWIRLNERLCEEAGYYGNSRNFTTRIPVKKSNKPDIHAILLLDEMFGESKDNIISFATYEWVVFEVTTMEAAKLTDDQICELLRCYVEPYEEDRELLGMHI